MLYYQSSDILGSIGSYLKDERICCLFLLFSLYGCSLLMIFDLELAQVISGALLGYHCSGKTLIALLGILKSFDRPFL